MIDEIYDEVLIVDVFFTGLWGTTLVLWMVNNCINSASTSNSLHKLITFSIALKFLNVLSLSFHLFISIEEGSHPLNLVISSTYSLYSTFKYTSLLLISKGFFVTRTHLDRPEVLFLAIVMGVLYLSFSAYIVEKEKIIVLLVIIHIALFFLVVRFSERIINLLKLRSQQLRDHSLALWSTLDKLKSMNIFLWTVQFLFLQKIFSKLVLHLIVQPVWFSQNPCFAFGLSLFDQGSEFCCLIVIFFFFRAKKHRHIGRIPQMETGPIQTVPFYRTKFSTHVVGNPQIMLLSGKKTAFIATKAVESPSILISAPLEEPLLNNYNS